MYDKPTKKQEAWLSFENAEDMKLIDHFAGQALTGLLTKLHYRDLDSPVDQREVVDLAWSLASDMVRRRIH